MIAGLTGGPAKKEYSVAPVSMIDVPVSVSIEHADILGSSCILY